MVSVIRPMVSLDLAAQVARHGVGAVAQRATGLEDALLGDVGDRAAGLVAEDQRDGGGRDTRCLGHVRHARTTQARCCRVGGHHAPLVRPHGPGSTSLLLLAIESGVALPGRVGPSLNRFSKSILRRMDRRCQPLFWSFGPSDKGGIAPIARGSRQAGPSSAQPPGSGPARCPDGARRTCRSWWPP